MRTVQYEHASMAACQNLRFKSEPRPMYTSGMHPCGEVWRGGYFVLGHDNNRDCSFHVTSRQRRKKARTFHPSKADASASMTATAARSWGHLSQAGGRCQALGTGIS